MKEMRKVRRILSIILIACMVLLNDSSVYAEKISTAPESIGDNKEEDATSTVDMQEEQARDDMAED